ncbi:MAG: SRPBCC family protein [Pseudonocardia sp.]|nr:SRPBCC family protein [Pseudonocardia sp.]
MTRFSATNYSEAVVAADRSKIWAALTDPVLLPELTPLLARIETDGDLWHWYLKPITVLGINVGTVFTELMRFDEGRRIDYTHEPPYGANERTGAEGWYELSDTEGGTRLAISMTLHVDLPLAPLVTPVVSQVMATVMQRTGDRFSVNLLRHLGIE